MRQEVVVLVCDHCGIENGVQTYEIRRERERVPRTVDLCERGAAPLEKVLSTIGSAPRTRRRAGGAARRRVTSIEEIEAMKTKKKS